MNLNKFQIVGIHIPKSYTNKYPSSTSSSYPISQYYLSTLLIILSNGSRIYLSISPNKLQLLELINLPNLE